MINQSTVKEIACRQVPYDLYYTEFRSLDWFWMDNGPGAETKTLTIEAIGQYAMRGGTKLSANHADQPFAEEIEDGESSSDDQRAVRVGSGRDEARGNPQAYQDGCTILP